MKILNLPALKFFSAYELFNSIIPFDIIPRSFSTISSSTVLWRENFLVLET